MAGGSTYIKEDSLSRYSFDRADNKNGKYNCRNLCITLKLVNLLASIFHFLNEIFGNVFIKIPQNRMSACY